MDAPVVFSDMDGTWTLQFDPDRSGRSITGTAMVALSNDIRRAFTAKGRTDANDTAVLTISGDPAEPAAKAIAITAKANALAGGRARIESLAAKGYGQVVAR
jgi:hypothetical protein